MMVRHAVHQSAPHDRALLSSSSLIYIRAGEIAPKAVGMLRIVKASTMIQIVPCIQPMPGMISIAQNRPIPATIPGIARG